MALFELPLLLAASAMMPIELPPQERLRIAFLTTFGVVWFFWLGAALGSYLNVVVYRMPLGLASVAPDSRCPECKTPIRWYDNVPIFSWLALGGKCRSCRKPISPRYLIVEAVMGLLFVLLLIVEVLTGGANLPVRVPRGYPGMSMIEHFLQWDLVGIYAYHAALVWFATGIALFAIDGHRVPRSYAIAALVLILAPPFYWPELRPVPLWQPILEVGLRGGFEEAIAGIGVGTLFGYLLSLDYRRTDQLKADAATILLGALVGSALGWHAALMWFSLSACAWLLHVLICYSGGKKKPLPLAIIAAASLLALLAGWSGFYGWFPQPGTLLRLPPARNQLPIMVLFSILAAAVGGYLEERLNPYDGGQASPLNLTPDS